MHASKDTHHGGGASGGEQSFISDASFQRALGGDLMLLSPARTCLRVPCRPVAHYMRASQAICSLYALLHLCFNCAGDILRAVKDNRVYSMSPIFIQQVNQITNRFQMFATYQAFSCLFPAGLLDNCLFVVNVGGI